MIQKLNVLLPVLLAQACTSVEVPVFDAGGSAGTAPASSPPSAFFDEVAYAAVQPTRQAKGRELGTRAAGIQLARMTVSEATSLQPMNSTWQLDMQGILQVARNTQDRGESLLVALKELSPHVGTLRQYTDPRQQWTSTLQAAGDGAPTLWVECIGWETLRGRKRGVPAGCDGVWELGAENWKLIRSYAIQLVQMEQPPVAVQGSPTTWGGLMDIAEFLKDRPNMCWLESGPTTNYFFGLKTDPTNVCKHMPLELVQESKVLSAEIASRSSRKRALER